MPSSYEGFGIVYLEGMQFGLPAIAGTAGAAKEIITHGHNGFLVPPGNPEALAHHIELLIRDRELLLKMSLAAHQSRRGPPHLERQRRPGPGLPPNFPEVTVSSPAAPDFIRYLAAKKGLDDRSLNRQVWDHLARAVRDRPDSAPLRVLEVGCGIGTMVERLLDRGLLTRAAYTGIDVEAGCIRAAAQRLHGYAAARQAPLTVDAGGAMLFCDPGPRRPHNF